MCVNGNEFPCLPVAIDLDFVDAAKSSLSKEVDFLFKVIIVSIGFYIFPILEGAIWELGLEVPREVFVQ